MTTILCPCGTTVQVLASKVGRKKYCSRRCMYAYRVRPSGLTYNLVAENSGQFKPGHVAFEGSAHPAWRGDAVGYKELHRWVAKNKTKQGVCFGCDSVGYTEWANASHEYRRDLSDWIELCRLCHRGHDSGEARGVATKRYGRAQVQARRSS